LFPFVSQNFLISPCNWQQVERKFTVNDDDFKTLVIYAESGGALIDDVEIYPECYPNIYVQNKNYDVLFGPNAIEGFNFREKAGAYLTIGQNVDNTRQSGKVIPKFGSKVNFSGDEIRVEDGFECEFGSEVHLATTPCAYFMNRNWHPTDTAKNIVSTNQESMIKNEDRQAILKPLIITPNPGQGVYTPKGVPNEEFSVQVLSLQGEKLRYFEKLSGNVEINITDLDKGMYFFVCKSSLGYTKSIKVIKE
jgi:hypothetical protein